MERVVWLLTIGVVLALVVSVWPGDAVGLKDVILIVMSVVQSIILAGNIGKGQERASQAGS